MIHIPSNRINIHSGRPGQLAPRPRAQAVAVAAPRPRAHVNFIPSPESLATLISGAIDALKKGVRWDRGSILNLLV